MWVAVVLRRAGEGSFRMTAVQPEYVRLCKSSSQGKRTKKREMCQNVSYTGELERTGNVIKKNNTRETRKTRNFKKLKKDVQPKKTIWDYN